MMFTRSRTLMAASAIALLAGAGAWLLTSQPAQKTQTLGPTPDGGYLIPNGWKVKPVGTQTLLDTYPMASLLSKDGKHLIVLNGGYKPPSLIVLDPATMKELSRTPVSDGWLGLTFSKDEKFVYVGGGSRGAVFEFAFNDGKLTPARTFPIVPAADVKPEDFIGDVQTDGRLLYVAMLHRDAIAVVNPQSGRVIEKFPTGRRPYRILFHPDFKSFFVSSWADGSVYHHNAQNGEKLGQQRIGPHPTDMLLSSKTVKAEEQEAEDKDKAKKPAAVWKHRIFVTAGNTNHVFVIGVDEAKEMRLVETISVAMSPRQPAGMTPSALAFSPDEETLHVVCSDANAVAVVDIDEAKSKVQGFIPSAWYPIAARVLPDKRLLIFNGRGLRSFPNPGGPKPVQQEGAAVHEGIKTDEYVGRLQVGSVSTIPPFDADTLAQYTKQTFENSPYRDTLLDNANVPAGSVIPNKPGDKSPIEHVVYILKENRTYDQVLGDIGIGNSDPSLTLFGEKYSPNHHKLAREFVLLDNFYVNSDVSADGHNWSTAAIAPDYVQRMWPNSYGGRRKKYDYEGGEPAAIPPAGYLWTNAQATGISMRNYGFWTETRPQRSPEGVWVDKVKDPVLARVTNMKFPGFQLDIQDIERARIYLEDLAEFEKTNAMPKLTLLRIGNDHTSGTSPGKYTPLAAMADNDLALGMIVEALSKSKFWAKTAIFVVEDDAQNGSDHVDSHRSPAFVLSPYTRRGIVDSSFYNQTSILRTMELILGIKPMTQFDAAARPMVSAFGTQANLAPYTAEKARIDINERNPQKSATAARSMRMDFSREDAIDDDELNDILWRAIRGGEPPPPVRSFFASVRR
jgi:DNA-binding beta-propeller fold protein YncE/phospholipase C